MLADADAQGRPAPELPPAPEVSSGRLDLIESFPSQYIRARRVYVWLPESYSDDRRHDVLYMHDGQMLFDSSSTWNQQEWGVDEVAGRLMKEQRVRDFIVVAIDHAGTHTGRWLEYFPQRAVDYLPRTEQTEDHPLLTGILGADRYLKFLVEELKPYIHEHYSVHPGAAHSFIAGSSMGGLISVYAVSEYPDEFSGAACLSTHWPGVISEQGGSEEVNEALNTYLRRHLPEAGSHRIYFDHGTETLDALYPPLQKQVDAIMREKNYDEADWQTRVFTGAAHVEKDWNERLHIPLLFLLAKPD